MNPLRSLKEFDPAPFGDWIVAASGRSPETSDALRRSVAGFLYRYSPFFLDAPGPGWASMARVYRAVAARNADGRVRTSEFFRIRDVRAFMTNPDERAATLSETGWDDKATLFSERQPPRRTRLATTLLDHSGEASGLTLPDQIRQFEYLVNAAVRGADSGDLFEKVGDATVSTRHMHLSRELAASFSEIAGPLLLVHASRALEAFRASLVGSKLKAVSSAMVNSVSAYNWLAGVGALSADAEIGERREQAVNAYPFAWSALTSPAKPVLRTVDRGEPLATALAESLRISVATLRKMNGLTPSACGLKEAPSFAAMAQMAANVARMPPGASPTDETGWLAYMGAVTLVDAIAKTEPGAERGLLAALSGKWDQLDGGEMKNAASGFGDYASDIHVNALRPAARLYGEDGWSMARSVRTLVEGSTLPQIAAAVAKWHALVNEVQDRLAILHPKVARSDVPTSWLALHKGGGTWTAPNGMLVVPLITELALKRNARDMNHCVDTYVPRCLYLGSHILDVQWPDGKSEGTAEIAQDRAFSILKKFTDVPDKLLRSLPPSVLQFQGKSNDVEPSDEAWEALWSYVGGLMTGAVKVDEKPLSEVLKERLRTAPKSIESLGIAMTALRTACYDPGSREAVRDAWTGYAPALPRPVVKRGPAKLVENVKRKEAEEAASSARVPKREKKPRPAVIDVLRVTAPPEP